MTVYQSPITEPLLPRHDAIARLALSENGFVFDPQNGRSFSANNTGLFVLRQLQQSHDYDRLLKEVQREYAVEQREAERGILEFLRLVRRNVV